MFSLNGDIFAGKDSLGLGAAPKGSAASCPSGTIEYGSPSMCGSAADYDAYIQQQISGAYGGDKEKAKGYLQTTVYGSENNYGCTLPNIQTFDAAGKSICLHPDDAKKMGLITKCPAGTINDTKTGGCIKPTGSTPSGGGGTSVSKPAPAPPAPAPVEPPPSMMAGISPMMIVAGVLGFAALGAVVYKVRKDRAAKGGMSPNEYDEDY